MAKKTIVTIPAVGADSGNGTPLATAFQWINENFTELYDADASDVNSVTGSGGITATPTTGEVAVSITDGGVTNAKMAANSVDSDQYVDGSIDTVHLANDIVTYDKLAVEFTESAVISAAEVNFGSAQVFTKTLTGTTDFTYAGTEIGMVKDLIINADGNTFTLPTGTKIIAGTPTTGINFIQVVVTATGEYWTSISQEQ